jgi:hypothetical protein
VLDVIFVAVTVLVFVAATAYVSGCERLNS